MSVLGLEPIMATVVITAIGVVPGTYIKLFLISDIVNLNKWQGNTWWLVLHTME